MELSILYLEEDRYATARLQRGPKAEGGPIAEGASRSIMSLRVIDDQSCQRR